MYAHYLYSELPEDAEDTLQPAYKTKKQKLMRKAKPKKRLILPDPVFGDQKVSKFVNHLMYDGKKNVSYEIFYSALKLVGEKMSGEEKSALEIWKTALDKVTPPSGSKEPSYRWCYFPSSYRNPS